MLKMVHGWQQDGYQKGLFFGASDYCECPAGYGFPENRFHYMLCLDPMMEKGHTKKKQDFKTMHIHLKTAKVIYDAIICILKSMRYGTHTPCNNIL